MKKTKKSFLFGLTFALSAIISCFALSASATEDLQFSNAELEITFTDNDESIETDDNFAVSGSFTSSADSDKKYMIMLTAYDFDNILESVYISDQYAIAEGTNTFTYNAGAIKDAKKLKAYLWTEDMSPICEPVQKLHRLKVLAIGNSFSVDAMQWLYEIAEDQGVDKIVLGNLYIGGCSLETHWARTSSGTYNKYYKNTNGTWVTTEDTKMITGIQDEAWDFITLQQVSGKSGIPDTYEPYLSNLIDYVNTNKTNPEAKLAWHMTWAYQGDSTHSAFANYNKDQMTMYNAIVDTMKSKVYPHKEIAFCIPSGTAIQNARTSHYGDKMTRDGYHLSKQQGRYIAGLTWYHKISGMPIDNMTYAPNDILLKEYQQKVIRESVKNAVLYPEQVTPSKYPTRTACYTVDNDYTQLNFDYTVGQYWYSTNAAMSTTAGTAWIATQKFTKADLPNGTAIVLDDGYQYRPEGWIYADKKYTGTRPELVTSKAIEIDDTWWGEFNYRAFNIGRTDSAAITADEASHFKIYVPKSAATETATTEE